MNFEALLIFLNHLNYIMPMQHVLNLKIICIFSVSLTHFSKNNERNTYVEDINTFPMFELFTYYIKEESTHISFENEQRSSYEHMY